MLVSSPSLQLGKGDAMAVMYTHMIRDVSNCLPCGRSCVTQLVPASRLVSRRGAECSSDRQKSTCIKSSEASTAPQAGTVHLGQHDTCSSSPTGHGQACVFTASHAQQQRGNDVSRPCRCPGGCCKINLGSTAPALLSRYPQRVILNRQGHHMGYSASKRGIWAPPLVGHRWLVHKRTKIPSIRNSIP
jgi:hypothetical protein